MSTRSVFAPSLALLLLAATGHASASEGEAAGALDLSLPRTSAFASDPPGTWYGDTGGVPASEAMPGDGCDGELHGSMTAGIGYSSRGGNSNYQAVNLNTCKRYTSRNGKERQVAVSVSVGQGSGPAMYHDPMFHGGGFGAPPPHMGRRPGR